MAKEATFLHGRSATELLIISALSARWPFETNDPIWSAAYAADRMKSKHATLWAELCMDIAPSLAARLIVDLMLSETRAALRKVA